MKKGAQLVEIKRGRLLEEPRDLALKPAPFAGIGVRPERPQRGLWSAGFSERVFVQISAEDPMELRKGRGRVPHRRSSGYEVKT